MYVYCCQYLALMPYSPSRFFGHPCCFTWFAQLLVRSFIWGISSHLWRCRRIRWTSPNFHATIRPPTFLNHPPPFEGSSHGTSWKDKIMTNNIEQVHHLCSSHYDIIDTYSYIPCNTILQHCHDTNIKAATNKISKYFLNMVLSRNCMLTAI
jgi:hypothetical protein